MENILYLDDCINLYNKNHKKIICVKPYKNTLLNGHIIDRKKFIEKFVNIKRENKLHNKLFNEKIIVIINASYKKEDKILLKEILEELNYKKVEYVNEINLIKIDKNMCFINFNEGYFLLYYLNYKGNVEMKIYANDYINKALIKDILNIINKSKIIITGKNAKELIGLLEHTKFNYYYYQKFENLFLNLLINN